MDGNAQRERKVHIAHAWLLGRRFTLRQGDTTWPVEINHAYFNGHRRDDWFLRMEIVRPPDPAAIPQLGDAVIKHPFGTIMVDINEDCSRYSIHCRAFISLAELQQMLPDHSLGVISLPDTHHK